MKNYFEILGLDNNSSIDDVQSKYEILIKNLDPKSEKYQKINEAYQKIIVNYIGNPNIESSVTKNPKRKKINILYIVLILILFLFPTVTYLLFLEKFDEFEKNVLKIEQVSYNNNQKNFNIYKEELNNYLKSNRIDYQKFNSIDDNKSISYYYSPNIFDQFLKKDTTFNFFYSKTISFKVFKSNYFDCLYSHVSNKFDYWILRNNLKSDYNLWLNRIKSEFQISDIELLKILDLVNNVKEGSKKNFFSLVYPFKIKNSVPNINCKNCFQKEIFQEKLVLNHNAQKDIENFIKDYLINKKNVARQSWLNKKLFNSKIEGFKKNMDWKLRVKLNEKIKSSNFINKQEMNFFYENKKNPLIEDENIESIPDINYSLYVDDYQTESIKEIVDNVTYDYYKNNSLKTGSKPYKYCYGNNPYCSPPNGYKECSFIDFKGPSNSDVIVIIKKNDRVYSHVYIKAGGYYKFKLGNGNFQSFFYYGKGWNPNKYIKTANCGRILGGFIKSEFVDKSEIINLYHSSMSYTLYSVTNGNFIPKSSNKNEAF